MMVSYQWDSQDVVVRLVASLKQRGFSLWFDLDSMSGAAPAQLQGLPPRTRTRKRTKPQGEAGRGALSPLPRREHAGRDGGGGGGRVVRAALYD